jgi:FAD-dependent urate hydroxylase
MTLRILVVGAGVAGLAAARGLRVAGFRPDVVEELPASTVPGAGIYLPGNASRALRQLGLDAPLRPLGDLIFRQVFQDWRGRELCELDVAALWAGVGESRALPRADLQRVLLTAVGGQVRYDTAVTDLEIDDGTAEVAFSDGSRSAYDLVVGADGRRSTIRAKAGLGGAATPTGQIVYRSVITGGPTISDWTALLGRRAAFVVMPMGGRKLYCYADESAEPGSPAPADPLARVRELFGSYGGVVPAVLDAMEKVQVARTDEVVIDSWSRGPVLLVGDAAHATSPTLAQGAAMSFEDAVVLGEVLRSAPDVDTALKTYEERRRPRTGWVRERTRERDRTRDVPPALRDPMLRRRGTRIFGDHYRGLVEPL